MTERHCVCCGFSSENLRLFKRYDTRYQAGWWICRSEKRCITNTRDGVS